MSGQKEYMLAALEMAMEAFEDGEVPVGAVIVRNSEIISRGRNRREKEKNALLHAEIDAIDQACKTLGGWRLWDCELYVTLEPCPMCAGAIMAARISRLVYGAADARAGAVESIFNIPGHPSLAPMPEITAGVMEDECKALLQTFFAARR